MRIQWISLGTLAWACVAAAPALAWQERAEQRAAETLRRETGVQVPVDRQSEAEADREVAISHALGMAIEGSNLWCLAHRDDANRPAAAQPGQPDARAELERHARDAFQSSDRLFQAIGQNANDGQRDAGRQDAREEFLRASREYARMLQSLCSQQGGQQFDRVEGADRQRGQGATITPSQFAEMALINHAVREAVQGAELRKMVRHHDDQGVAARALLSHAEQMIASSDQALRWFDNPAPGGAARGAANAPGARNEPAPAPSRGENFDPNAGRDLVAAQQGHDQVRTLARLGREVIQAARQLDPEGGAPAAPDERGNPAAAPGGRTNEARSNPADRGDANRPNR